MDHALDIEREAMSRLRVMDEAMAAGDSEMQRFYSDAVMFITGGSGYMGKQMLEKLFRSCAIKKSYLLLRPKKGKSVEDRLNEILKDSAYNSLQQNRPDFKQRIVPVEGDVAKLRLGISDANWRDITENVTMIFHVAATVKFDEDIKTAVLTNVRGTREVLHLAKKCSQLKSFLYVSTAYSNATRTRIGTQILEEFYPAPVAPDVLINMVESFSETRLEEMTSKLIGGWPNTYSYSKAVAEELVRTLGSNLPVCIVRPAIVICAYHEPLPGWIDNRCMYGTSGIGLACLMGILHVIVCRGDVTINLIPVDYVNNAIMAAAKAAGTRWNEGKKETMIYNITSDRSFLWGHCLSDFNNILSRIPSPKIVGDCFAVEASNDVGYYVLILLLHYIPATLIDILCVLVGKRPWLIDVYNRIHKLSRVTKYFTLNNWLFADKNTQELYHNLSKSDKLIYNFDRNSLDVQKMMVLWALGMRKFIIKDDLKGTKTGRKKQILFKLLCLCILLIYFSVCLLFIKMIIGLF